MASDSIVSPAEAEQLIALYGGTYRDGVWGWSTLDSKGEQAAVNKLRADAAQATANANLAFSMGIATEQLALAKEQAEMAKKRYKYWEKLFQPVERKFVAAANVGIDPAFAAARAGADVTASFDKATDIQARNLMRTGIDPSSPRFAALATVLAQTRAAAEAGARNQARAVTLDTNLQRRYQAAQLGRDIPAQAASQAASAAGIYGAAAQTARQGSEFAVNTGLNILQMQQQAQQFYAQLAQQNRISQNAMYGGIAQGVGQLATTGAVVGAMMCWVAREVYGESDPKWLLFRQWLLKQAPRWFRALYLKYGQRIAAWLRDKPKTKRLIRWWMDQQIARLA